MILYLDTSALVKAYVDEISSKEVLSLISNAKTVATHSIAYVEAHATFARLRREKKLTDEGYESVKIAFNKDWENYLQIENSPTLLVHAANLADVLALRAYASMHIAAADFLAKQSKLSVNFACFDRQLNKAANILGLLLPDFSI